MQRQAPRKRRTDLASIATPGTRDGIRDRLDRPGSIGPSPVDLNGTRQQFELLFACRVDEQVDVAPLHLRPLVPLFARKTLRVFLKRLVEDPDHDESAAASAR